MSRLRASAHAFTLKRCKTLSGVGRRRTVTREMMAALNAATSKVGSFAAGVEGMLAAVLLASALTLTGCDPDKANVEERPEEPGKTSLSAERVLTREVTKIDAKMTAVDALFQPLPLLGPAQERALRHHPYREQLARAQALGVDRNASPEQLEILRRNGRLVLLEDTTYWVVRELDYSRPLVVPGLRALLTEIGKRFHARLAAFGLPPLRMEISSVLRTAQDQAALREANPNAAEGASTHEYAAAVDVVYSAFAAPVAPIAQIDAAEASWVASYLRRYQDVAAERIGGRRALELKAILGKVLLEVQQEGRVMVTLERRQPVFHLTLARKL